MLVSFGCATTDEDRAFALEAGSWDVPSSDSLPVPGRSPRSQFRTTRGFALRLTFRDLSIAGRRQEMARDICLAAITLAAG